MMNLANNRFTLGRLMLCVSAVAISLFAIPAKAQNAAVLPPELKTLVDRAAIEDLMVDYYSQIGSDNHDFSRFFTANGVLEVNGLVAKGKAEIVALYDRAGGMGAESSDDENKVPTGKFNMMMSNLKVAVQGDTATATLLWFSIVSPKLTDPPAVTEHGHDTTDLVRQNGHWLINKRVVFSDGGMPEGLLQPYLSARKKK